ncbi:MAG: SPOR domain-containing protein [Bacteroidaceae bacterium]|nr:SPOR domain-containing protein [Bacteroidaceae bacterium]
MISLARHIELLLLEHDCVIVPGLGGFIANHAEARYTGDEEQLFLPPYRTIGFNQQLQVNDGLLVQSYMAAYDTSYPAANLQMEKDLEKMMQELEMNGEYELENVGTLKKGLNENISFISPETGALTPSLYGLYSYEMKSLQHVIKEKDIERNLQAAAAMHIAQKETAAKVETEKQEPKQNGVVIRINRHWLDVGISAAAAVVLFFCFSYMAMNQPSNNADTVVASFPTMEKVAVKANTPAAKPAEAPAKEKVATETPVKAEPAKESAEKAPVKVEPAKESAEKAPAKVEPAKVEPVKAEPAKKAGRYAIVLATYVSQDNAERFIKTLAKEGLGEGRYVKNGKVSRVLYSEYANEAAAQEALGKFRKQNSAFSDAWILEL